ncbi:MAG: hypothetical protein U0641_18870 [Anaerolineae bacterium]
MSRPPTWREMNRDTSPEVERLQLAWAREAPAWRKIDMIAQLNRTALTLAWNGLRASHPSASPAELRRKFAQLPLGAELAARVYPATTTMSETMSEAEPIAITLTVIATFDALHVPYLIGGSFASGVYGVVRSTMDADLVADLRAEHVEALVSALTGEFYVDARAIYDAIRERGSFNVIHLATMFKVDVFLPRGRPYDTAEFERRIRRVVANAPDRSAYVASAEDTILTKLEWYRSGGEVSERQWRDILGILKTQGALLDVVYLREWAQQLGIADLLELALGAADR